MNHLRGAQIDGFVVLGEVVHDRVLAYREESVPTAPACYRRPSSIPI